MGSHPVDTLTLDFQPPDCEGLSICCCPAMESMELSHGSSSEPSSVNAAG